MRANWSKVEMKPAYEDCQVVERVEEMDPYYFIRGSKYGLADPIFVFKCFIVPSVQSRDHISTACFNEHFTAFSNW